MTTWFAYPWVFWALPALAMALLVALWGWHARRRSLALLGAESAVRKLLLINPAARRWRIVCLFLGLVLLVTGSAGPQWGRDWSRETGPSQDLLLVLDVSRSMLAEQPSRLERGLRTLRDLADDLQRRGGQRLGLVIFAARPHLAFPLTQDLDHLRYYLSQIGEQEVPASVRPKVGDAPPSGTRLGAAVGLAVRTATKQSKGQPMIVLLSDGDDPAHDEEWLDGVHEARAVQLPIHTVGLGNPHQESSILIGGDLLQHEGKVVKTRLEEKVLQEVARRTGGVYIPAQTARVPLGSLLRENLARQPPGAKPKNASAAAPVFKGRHAWFLWPALVFLATALLIRTRPRRNMSVQVRLASAVAGMYGLMLVGAGYVDDELIRQGNSEFSKDHFDEARALYEKAEETARDPGLVAFNEAAALYRLGRFRDAELHYLRSLDDDRAPAERRQRAYLGLGIAVMRQAGAEDRALLERAIDAFASCLALQDRPNDLTTDAQHDLELARWLRLRAKPTKKPDEQDPNQEPNGAPKKKPVKQDPTEKPAPNGPKGVADKPVPGKVGQERPDLKERANPGPLHLLPDVDKLVALPAEDTSAYLRQLAERIVRQRREYERGAAAVLPHVKDW